MKKEDVHFLSVIGVILSPFVFLWLRGIPAAYYHGPHDESFYAYVVVKIVVLFIFILFVFGGYIITTILFEKIVYRAIFIFGVSLAFYGLIFFLAFHGENQEETVRKQCLLEAPGKCSDINMSEEEFLKEINDLKLSKKEARKSFLKSQEENQASLMRYSNKNEKDLTLEEKGIKTALEGSALYFERALKAVEKMNDSSWFFP